MIITITMKNWNIFDITNFLTTRLGENPMAKYSLEDFVGVLKSMRSLRVAFDDLMESYRCFILVTLILVIDEW